MVDPAMFLILMPISAILVSIGLIVYSAKTNWTIGYILAGFIMIFGIIMEVVIQIIKHKGEKTIESNG